MQIRDDGETGKWRREGVRGEVQGVVEGGRMQRGGNMEDGGGRRMANTDRTRRLT